MDRFAHAYRNSGQPLQGCHPDCPACEIDALKSTMVEAAREYEEQIVALKAQIGDLKVAYGQMEINRDALKAEVCSQKSNVEFLDKEVTRRRKENEEQAGKIGRLTAWKTSVEAEWKAKTIR